MRLLTALCLAGYLLIDSGGALFRAREAMALWAASVAPSLFPFLALLPALTDDEALRIYEKLFGKCMKKLFHVSGACAAPCLIGMLAGSPAGSIATLRAYESGAISKKDARVLVALSTGVGPVFVISSVGGGMMGDVSEGVKLFLCVWVSSVLTAFFVSRLRREGENTYSDGVKQTNPPGAIREAVLGILTVAGYMTAFRVFAGGLPDIMYAFFEISGGCAVAAEKNSFVLGCAVIGFGGVCLMMQNYASLKKTGVGFGDLLSVKAAACVLCTLFGCIVPEFSILHIRLNVDAYELSCVLGMSMALLCAGFAVGTRAFKKQRMKQK